MFEAALSVLAHPDLSVHFRIMFPTSSPRCHLCSSPRSVQAIKQACICTPLPTSREFLLLRCHPQFNVRGRTASRPTRRGLRGWGGGYAERCIPGQRKHLSPHPQHTLCNWKPQHRRETVHTIGAGESNGLMWRD